MTNKMQVFDDPSNMPIEMKEAATAASFMMKSGYFKDVQSVSQGMVKVLAGREMGLKPFQSLQGIHVIKGKPVVGAALLATTIKRSGVYTYRVVEHTATCCRIEFLEIIDGAREVIGVSEYTVEEAKAAGLPSTNPTWNKFPKNMLFARALSNGARWYCPDVFGGAVYTDGEVMEAAAADLLPPLQAVTAPAPEPFNEETGEVLEAEIVTETPQEDGPKCTESAMKSIKTRCFKLWTPETALERFNNEVVSQFPGNDGLPMEEWEALLGESRALVRRYAAALKRLEE